VIPAAVGAYIAAAYWFTSSTSFANPAVTIGRAFTDTFAGIAPGDVLGFVVAQGAGLVLAVVGVKIWYPRTPEIVAAVPADRGHRTRKEVGV
jgi:arsenate reductase